MNPRNAAARAAQGSGSAADETQAKQSHDEYSTTVRRILAPIDTDTAPNSRRHPSTIQGLFAAPTPTPIGSDAPLAPLRVLARRIIPLTGDIMRASGQLDFGHQDSRPHHGVVAPPRPTGARARRRLLERTLARQECAVRRGGGQ